MHSFFVIKSLKGTEFWVKHHQVKAVKIQGDQATVSVGLYDDDEIVCSKEEGRHVIDLINAIPDTSDAMLDRAFTLIEKYLDEQQG